MKRTFRHLDVSLFILTASVCDGSAAETYVQPPLLTPNAGDAAVVLGVVVSSATPGAEIHYTLNGEEPTKFHPTLASGGSISVARSSIIKAKAWVGELESSTTTEHYRITGAISCGYQHGLALSVAGRIWSWGDQGSGRLGNGLTSSTDLVSPVRVLQSPGFFDTGAQIAAGYDQSLVLDQNRTVWAFGENGDGQLGCNSTSDSGVPVRVLQSATAGDFLEECIGIDAGQGFSIALRSSGTPVAWGSQSMGRLGNGSTSSTSSIKYATPVKRGDDPTFPELADIIQVDAGYAHAMAREAHSTEEPGSTGRVWIWGRNHAGQLAQGNTDNLARALPMLLSANNPVTDAIDISGGGAHSAVVRFREGSPLLNGTVWCCGNQSAGRLGNGLTSSADVKFLVAVKVAQDVLLTGVRQVSAGPSHTLAVDGDGHVWAWGANQYGQLGNNSNTDSGYAIQVKDSTGMGVLQDIVWVSAGGESTNGRSMALATDGTIWVWGRNDEGQLGNGGTASAIKLPISHTQNRVYEGIPAVVLSHSFPGETEPYSVTLTANPSHTGPDGNDHLSTVKFFINGSLVDTKSAAPWITSEDDLIAGKNQAYAIVTDEFGVSAMSAMISFNPTDLDGDGMPNDWELEHELDPRDAADASQDPDADNLSNAGEFQHSTNPHDKDTDDDYVPDGIEVSAH